MWPAVGQGGEGACRGLGRNDRPHVCLFDKADRGRSGARARHAVTADNRHKTEELQSGEPLLLRVFPIRPRCHHACMRLSRRSRRRSHDTSSTSPACGTMPPLTSLSASKRGARGPEAGAALGGRPVAREARSRRADGRRLRGDGYGPADGPRGRGSGDQPRAHADRVSGHPLRVPPAAGTPGRLPPRSDGAAGAGPRESRCRRGRCRPGRSG